MERTENKTVSDWRFREYASSVGSIFVFLAFAYFFLLWLYDPPPLDKFIRVSIRSSLIDQSTGVLQIHNKSQESLTLDLVINNRDTNQMKQFQVIVDANSTQEVGALEAGWFFEPNERVAIFELAHGYHHVIYDIFKAENGGVGIKKAR